MTGDFAYAHDVADLHTFFGAEGVSALLLGIADDAVDFWHRRETLRIDLRRAASDDDVRIGAFASRAPDGLPCLAHGFTGNGARVDDHRVVQIRFPRARAHGFALVSVE